ncbi:uridine phosphorylase [Elusimicrobium posterum]|uniref:nucleoside phosphorylase n=1 Tax=Elusimicrobium posterum TaxID=3116653 RepID=UPI003C726CCC
MLFNKADKLKSKPYFTARNYVELKKLDIKLPKTVIMIPIAHIDPYLSKHSKKRIKISSATIDIIHDNVAVVSNYGMGAPVTAMIQEILIELGVENFIVMGIAGGMGKTLNIGDIVLCDSVYCDDGTSKDYLSEDVVKASDKLLSFFKEKLKHNASGPTWTTDSIFRETVAELVYYKEQGVQTVEMEAGAIFSICKLKNLNALGIFIISDLLTGDEWEPVLFDSRINKIFVENIEKVVNLSAEL